MVMEIGDIQITDGGQLAPEAGMLVLGHMLFPNCHRSARQFSRIISEETVAKAKDEICLPSHLLKAQVDVRLINRLLLCGQIAARVCRNQVTDGAANLSRAAHVVSEVNSTIRTNDGKSLLTDEKRLRAKASILLFIASILKAVAHTVVANSDTTQVIIDYPEMMLRDFKQGFLAAERYGRDMLDAAIEARANRLH